MQAYAEQESSDEESGAGFELVVNCVSEDVFDNVYVKEEFEALFRSHGSHAQFRYVACFKRVFVLYLLQIHCDAAQKELDGFEFEGSELRVSRLKRPTSSQLLRAPRKRKDFLISPPISPPTDGIVGGSGAVASLALQAAIATLGGLGSSFELHPGSEEQNQPQIIVTQD